MSDKPTIIYGFHSVTSYIKVHGSNVNSIYLDKDRGSKRQQELIDIATTHNISCNLVDSQTLDRLTNTNKHQGVAAYVTALPTTTLAQTLVELHDKKQAVVLILDGITDPQNLGSILRTAECFAVDAIILPKNNSANTDNSAVIKASCGAINHLTINTVNNLSMAIKELKQHDFWIAGTSLASSSINLFEFSFAGRLAIIMGNEHSGMRRLVGENCDYLLKIPHPGTTQSLNVAVATGIVLAHLSKPIMSIS